MGFEKNFSPTLTSRYEQAFPVLSESDLVHVRRFGKTRKFSNGQLLFTAGAAPEGMFVIIQGTVAVTQRDGMGHSRPILEQGPGHFIAEVGQLSGQAALVDVMAIDAVEALVLLPDDLRSLIVAEAELGSRITRALILRRVSLLEADAGGPLLIGCPGIGSVTRLQNFLSRNGQPHRLLDPAVDPEAKSLVSRLGLAAEDLPIAICPDGSILRNPSDVDLANAMGMTPRVAESSEYDLAIVGAGPAGLATAVYGASEGLSVVVFDRKAYGGQAGASARIENYLGFPTGISGLNLTGRAYVQAQKFGALMRIPALVTAIGVSDGGEGFMVHLEAQPPVHRRSLVIASGAEYRRPNIEGLSDFEGKGVWYWASPLEGRLCQGREVIVVGGGNSAGQASVFLSAYASRVRILVRGRSLKKTMSTYLIERIEATANIEISLESEITTLRGDASGRLDEVHWIEHAAGTTASRSSQNVFIFAGADPATHWIDTVIVKLDEKGFVITGGPNDALHKALESSTSGIFAIGDVRAGSSKRVGSAIGEGAQVVAAIHAFLAEKGTQAQAGSLAGVAPASQ